MMEREESESWREARGETGSIRLSSINCKLITISNGLGVSDAKDFVKYFYIFLCGREEVGEEEDGGHKENTNH